MQGRQTRSRSRTSRRNETSSDVANAHAISEEATTSSSAAQQNNEPAIESDNGGETTPSASFLDELPEDTSPKTSGNEPIGAAMPERAWWVYTLKEKNMRSLLQAEVLNAYIEADVIPKGLIIRKKANVDKRNEEHYRCRNVQTATNNKRQTGKRRKEEKYEEFHKEWNFMLKEFSLRLMEFLIDYYERSVPENEAEIEECYRLMMEEDGWTECNRSEFDKEMKAIIVKKEKELRAEKIKKFQKIGRKKETQAQVLYKSNSETYAEVLKKTRSRKVEDKKQVNFVEVLKIYRTITKTKRINQ